MISPKEPVGICISLDCLNDTRLATLALMDQNAAVEALNNLCIDRVTDDPRAYCTGVDPEEFKERYKNRNKETLHASFPTKMFFDLKVIVQDLEARIIAKVPDVGRVRIDVNIWPYELNKAEQDELLKQLRVQIGAMIPVGLINVPLVAMTNEWIAANDYAVLYIYDYQEWLDSTFNSRTDVILKIPNVTLYFPALMLSIDGLKLIDEMKNALGAAPDIFKVLRTRCIFHMNIEWVSSIYYSIAPQLLLPLEGENANGP